MTSPAGTEDVDNAKQFSVNWSNHMNHVRSAFDNLLTARELVDVTLYCEGQKLGAHKMLLSACSNYFREIFKDIPCQHPVIILKGVQSQVLQDILKFIYSGEVSIDSQNFDAFLKTAQLLQVSGLTESNDDTVTTPVEQQPGSHSDNGNARNKTNNNQHLVKKEHSSTKHKTNSCVKEVPVKRKRDSTESCSTSPVQNIKCEPGELISYEDNIIDPLHAADQEIDPDIDETFLGLPTHSLHDYKDEPTKFESVYVSEDPIQTPARQSAFSESSLKCGVCNKVFSHPYSLHHHKAVHSGSTECPICHAVLSRKYNLKIHMKARHNV